MNHTQFKVVILLLILLMSSCDQELKTAQGPFFTTGLKIGEVTDSSVIIWSRLAKNAQRVGVEAPMPKAFIEDTLTGEWKELSRESRPNVPVKVIFPESHDINTIEGAVPGVSGQLQLHYRKEGEINWNTTKWLNATVSSDYTAKVKLEDLEPSSAYEIKLICRAMTTKTIGDSILGNFTTAPLSTTPKSLTFTAITCTAYRSVDSVGYGYKVYDQMAELEPDFFLHLGDIFYYDHLGKTNELACWHWNRMYSLPTHIAFHKNTPSYFLKDDHDTWMDDCWPGKTSPYMGDFTVETGQEFFLQEVPIDTPTYRTVRWGKDLQIWMVEGRDYRSPNTMEDGPEKSIWGAEQKKWFYRTVEASDATYKILFTPTPIVGPDRKGKKDNHSNDNWKYEGDEIRSFLATQDNMYVICGDRHWQYVSEEATTSVKEFSCGPASDIHAQGWKQEDLRPEHSYLNVRGGFLSGAITYTDGLPQLAIRHHAVDGSILNEEKL